MLLDDSVVVNTIIAVSLKEKSNKNTRNLRSGSLDTSLKRKGRTLEFNGWEELNEPALESRLL